MGIDLNRWNAPPTPVHGARWNFEEVLAAEGDLVAVGADLEPATLIQAYRAGVFPMEITGAPGLTGWWSPDPRGVLPLDALRVTASLRRSTRRFEVRLDTCFDEVIRACADPSRKDGWITEEFIAAYTRLHRLGWAHSIEVFDRDGALAGGLYGVRVSGLFAGESMFHRQRDASKVALMALVDAMRASGMCLLDVQWSTAHLASLGVVEIPRAEYLRRVAAATGEEREVRGAG